MRECIVALQEVAHEFMDCTKDSSATRGHKSRALYIQYLYCICIFLLFGRFEV